MLFILINRKIRILLNKIFNWRKRRGEINHSGCLLSAFAFGHQKAVPRVHSWVCISKQTLGQGAAVPALCVTMNMPTAVPKDKTAPKRREHGNQSFAQSDILVFLNDNERVQFPQTSFILFLVAHSPDISWVLVRKRVQWKALKILYGVKCLCLGCRCHSTYVRAAPTA